MSTFLSYLKQPSTYRGLTVLAGLVGWQLDPSQAAAIGSVVVGILALIETFRNEAK